MAAINFPDAPTNGQIFESGGMSWTYVAGIGWTLNSAIVEAGSGFTFIADTMPLPVNVGDTWFDSSTGASGGTSWVAVEEGPAGASEKVWVQFAPGVASTVQPVPVTYTVDHAPGYGVTPFDLQLGNLFPPAPFNATCFIHALTWIGFSGATMSYSETIMFATGVIAGTGVDYSISNATPSIPGGQWARLNDKMGIINVYKGNVPGIHVLAQAAIAGQNFYYTGRWSVTYMPATFL